MRLQQKTKIFCWIFQIVSHGKESIVSLYFVRSKLSPANPGFCWKYFKNF